MRLSFIPAVVAAAAAFALSAQAKVIDFTAAEGYANGPLHTQEAYAWWCGNPGNIEAWQVDTSGSGVASISSAAGDWKKITYSVGSALTEGYAGSFDFTVTVSNTVASSATLVIFGLEDSLNSYLGPAFELKAEPDGGFSLSIWNDASSTGGSTGIGATDIGLPGGIGISARLRMAFTTTTNAGAGTWTTVLTLTNLDTSASVGKVTDANWTASARASHLTMEQAQLNTISGSDGSIKVDRITIEPAVATPPLPPPFALIHFTSDEGYINGPLDAQHGSDWWKNGSSTSWQVDTSGTGNATISGAAGEWQNIAYNLKSSLTNGYAGTLDFSFSLTAPASAETPLMNCKPQDSTDGYRGPSFEFKAAPAGDFCLSIWNQVSGGFTKKYFRGSTIGMDTGIGTSAKLRMVFTTRPTAAGTWNTEYMVLNLDTGSNTLATVTESGWAGKGWVSHLRIEAAQFSTLSADGLLTIDRITMGLLTAPAEPPVITFQKLGNGQLRLEWPGEGTLQAREDLGSGSWQPISGATSPYTNNTTGLHGFYRIQVSP